MVPLADTIVNLCVTPDATLPVAWNTIAWSSVTPPGTSLAISVRTGSTPAPDATWSSFARVAVSGPPA